tara:strand:+ start:212 stop:352 length:141 start_codon:yes stop_codon:yes gene_type:complete
MGYGLGSEDLKELAYYNKNIQEMDDIKQDSLKKTISLNGDIPEGID